MVEIQDAKMTRNSIAPEAQMGFASAAAYDQSMPTYDPKVVESLLSSLEVLGVERARIVDLAAGTGKFTELLASRPEKYEIIAIEPHDGMREQLRQKKLKGVQVLNGTAEDMRGVADGSVAALIAAQSFHWFANMDALKEIHRVLQPTGVLGLIWNIEYYNSPKSWQYPSGWETKMRDVIWTFDDNQPRFRHEKWKQIFEDQAKSNPLMLHFADPLFSLPLGEEMFEFETGLSKDAIWKRLRTLSQLAILEGADLEKVKQIFDEAINSSDTVVDDQGRVAVHGKTYSAWTTRIPGAPLKSGG